MIRTSFIALLLISPAAASEHNSHVSIPAARESSSPSDVLKQHQQEMALNLAVSGKLQPGMVPQLKDRLRQLPSGSQFDELLKRVATEHGMSPEAMRALIPQLTKAFINQP